MSATTTTSASLRGCCCCLLLLFSFLFLLSLAILLIIVLAIKPKTPQFDLQQVTLQSLNLSSSNTFPIQMLFMASNDNIAGIKYRDSTFTVMYRGIPVGRGLVRGFYQAAHSVKRVVTTVVVDRANLMQADGDEFVKDVTIGDRVEFRVMGDVSAKVRVVGITSPSVQVSLDCAIVISPSKQALVSKQCGFDGLQAPRALFHCVPKALHKLDRL